VRLAAGTAASRCHSCGARMAFMPHRPQGAVAFPVLHSGGNPAATTEDAGITAAAAAAVEAGWVTLVRGLLLTWPLDPTTPGCTERMVYVAIIGITEPGTSAVATGLSAVTIPTGLTLGSAGQQQHSGGKQTSATRCSCTGTMMHDLRVGTMSAAGQQQHSRAPPSM